MGAAKSATFEVNTDMDLIDIDVNDGQCLTVAANCSLRAAIQEANEQEGHDLILLNTDHVTLSVEGHHENDGLTGDLDILDSVDIIGIKTHKTLIDANYIDRVFDFSHANPNIQVLMKNVTIQHGDCMAIDHEDPCGSAFIITKGTITLEQLDITENRSFISSTPGIHIENACVIGHQVRINNNVGNSDQNLSFAKSGAFYVNGSLPPDTKQLKTCVMFDEFEISNNSGEVAILARNALVKLENGLISNNLGIGLHSDAANQIVLENTTITGHPQQAILNDGGSEINLIHSTIVKNGSDGSTVGGIHDVHGVEFPGGQISQNDFVKLTNTIVADNGPGFLANDIRSATSLGGNIIGEATIFSESNSDLTGVIVDLGKLQDLGGFAHAYQLPIEFVDLADNQTCLKADSRGMSRPLDGDQDGISQCDAGSIEMTSSDIIFANSFEKN